MNSKYRINKKKQTNKAYVTNNQLKLLHMNS